jgi:hypothetical protein
VQGRRDPVEGPEICHIGKAESPSEVSTLILVAVSGGEGAGHRLRDNLRGHDARREGAGVAVLRRELDAFQRQVQRQLADQTGEVHGRELRQREERHRSGRLLQIARHVGDGEDRAAGRGDDPAERGVVEARHRCHKELPHHHHQLNLT